MTKDELSESEIKLLEDMTNNVRLMPSDIRNAIKHALEILRSEDKTDDEPKPKFKVGDRVRFGEVGKPMQSGVIMEVHSTSTYSVFSQDGKMRYVPEEALNRDTEPTVEKEGGGLPKYATGQTVLLRPAGSFHKIKSICYRGNKFIYTMESGMEFEENVLSPLPESVPKIELTPDWQSYRMEFAAKIAVAYAEKGRYEPYEIGAEAVAVANGVVERLKNCKQ